MSTARRRKAPPSSLTGQPRGAIIPNDGPTGPTSLVARRRRSPMDWLKRSLGPASGAAPSSAPPEAPVAATAAPGALPGRLGKDRFGYSMPVDAPLYQRPPFYYRDARALTIMYETDAESAQDLLPEGLELPLPANAPPPGARAPP